MCKILVVYGSTYGQTERVAHRMAGILKDAGHAVETHRGDQLPDALPDLKENVCDGLQDGWNGFNRSALPPFGLGHVWHRFLDRHHSWREVGVTRQTATLPSAPALAPVGSG